MTVPEGVRFTISKVHAGSPDPAQLAVLTTPNVYGTLLIVSVGGGVGVKLRPKPVAPFAGYAAGQVV
jgi:hypothetical protein